MAKVFHDKDDHIAELEQWIRDLQTNVYVNCVYCGYRYGRDGDEIPADALRRHVTKCNKHPMALLINEVQDAIRMIDEPRLKGSMRQKLHDAVTSALE